MFGSCRRPGRPVWALAFAAILFLLCSLQPGQAQHAVLMTTNYYRVSGNTIWELRQSLDRFGPGRPERGVDAETRWQIDWSYTVGQTQEGCRIRGFKTKTTITVTLPEWTPGPGTPAGLVQRWEHYLRNLKAHEEGHQRFALAAAAAMRERVVALPESVTCQQLGEEINRLANAVVTEFRQKELQYDRTTRHGGTQGAVFP